MEVAHFVREMVQAPRLQLQVIIMLSNILSNIFSC